tara:strand:- start:116 stop:517 length:402 start_codon:yes stop_codon:yes gene_type:complete
MAKLRIDRLAKELEIDADSLLLLANEKLADEMMTGKLKTTWIDEEGQEILRDAIDISECIPKHYNGYVIKSAANPSYVYAFIDEIKSKVPVIIKRRWRGKLTGKNILIEEIKDINGKSYRHRERHHIKSLLDC